MGDRVEGNPYVGPRPFQRDESELFFGRDREVRQLRSLVVAHRVVLIYAASGAGKSSLINAGLSLALREAERFEVLPVTRIRALTADRPGPGVRNVYVYGLLTHLLAGDGDGPPAIRAAELEQESLAGFLERREHAVDADGFTAPRVLVVDQFEELFTEHADRWPQRQGFFEQLAEAVENDPLLRVVLAMREDYVAQLAPHVRLLTEQLRARFRLERLGPEAALLAATQPASRMGCSYAPGVAEKLVDDLLQVRVDQGTGEAVQVRGEYVDPVQLQVVCSTLWSALPAGTREITEEHRVTFGDVDEVLSQFFEETIAAAAATAGMTTDRLRERFEHAFITPSGTRGIVYWTPEATAGIPAAAIDELDGRHLISAEQRAGARWYELTHDRLIEPVRTANRGRRAARGVRRRRRQVRAGCAVGAAVVVAALVALLGGGGGSQSQQTASDALLEQVAQKIQGIDALSLILPTPRLRPVLQASFSSNGKTVVTLDDEGGITTWNTSTGQRRWHARVPGADIVSFSPRGTARLLVADRGGDASIASPTGRRSQPFSTAFGGVRTARFTDRGPMVLAVRGGDELGLVDRSSLGHATLLNGRSIVDLAGSRNVVAADVSRDGRLVATASTVGEDTLIALWDAVTGRRASRTSLRRATNALRLSDDGRALAIVDGRGGVRVLDTTSRRLLAALEPEEAPVTSLAFDRRGSLLAVAAGKTVHVISMTGAPPWEFHLPHAVTAVAIGADGDLLAAASADGTAQLRKLLDHETASILTGQRGALHAVAFSNDSSSIVTGAHDGTARLWGAKPNLVFAQAPVARRQGTLLTVAIHVKNTGTKQSEPTAVRLQAGEAPPVERRIPELAQDRSATVELSLDPGDASDYAVTIDPHRKVAELTRSDNLQSAVIPGTEKAVRAQIVLGAMTALRRHATRYTLAVPARMQGVLDKVHLPDVPRTADAGSFVTWCYFQAGAPDPNGSGYDGSGYTGTLLAHGQRVTSPQPGEVAIYGPGVGQHAAIYVGRGLVVSFGSDAGPFLLRANYRADLNQYRRYLG